VGAWGPGAFENDIAGDFCWSVTDGGGLAAIEDAFAHVLEADDEDLEAPAAEEAIAAAAIVARLKDGAPLDDGLEAWIAREKPAVSPALIAMAREALQRIVTPPSELLDLWQESDDDAAFRSGIESLLRRLG
jgi:hypothetical protein